VTHDSNPLSINLLGPFDVRVRGEPLRSLRSRKGQWLLSLLVLRDGREVQREWLADTLWPDSLTEEAFASLRQSLADLRRALGDEASRLQSPTSRTLRLELSGAGVDLLAFDAAISRGDPAALEHAVSLYRGPLLEGCAEAWILPEREAREQAYLQALEALAAAAMAGGEPAQAASYLRRGAAVDPLRQSLHQALMRALGAAGQYQAAVEVYQTLRRRLRRDFNAEPEPETQALYYQLRAEARMKAGVRGQGPGVSSGKSEDGLSPTVLTVPELATGDRRLASTPRHNMPVPPTRLIGREPELERLRELLSGEEARLVTLTGPGGTGKTRLGLQVAADLIARAAGAAPAAGFLDGVFFVSLAPVRDPDQVAGAIVRSLGLHEAESRPPQASLIEHLRDRQILLLLDNFEQVLDAAPLLAELLAAAPRLKLLVTSRAALRLRGEKEFPVPPLQVPVDGSWLMVDGPADAVSSGPSTINHQLSTLSQCPSVRLFIERAIDVRPDFALTPENAPAVVGICARLEGLPLAIELAAARMKLLPPEALLARLEHRLAVLTGGARDLPARQQTLRAAIAWSYDLLGSADQALFRQLSVFTGGFSLQAADAVVSGQWPVVSGRSRECARPLPELTTDHRPLATGFLDGLASLVNNSLLRQEGGSGGHPRYVMLETVREYELERLEESREADDTRRRHAEFFLELAEAAEPELTGAVQGEWLSRLDADYGNLRAALEWCIGSVISGQWPVVSPAGSGLKTEPSLSELTTDYWPLTTALRLVGALGRFWQIRGAFGEGRELLMQALSRSEGPDSRARGTDGRTGTVPWAEDDLGLAPARAKALSWAGFLALYQGDYGIARSLCEASLALWREVGDQKGVAGALGCMAIIAKDSGDRSTAEALFQESLALWRDVGDRTGIAGTLGYLGILAAGEGSAAAARSFYTESLALRREQHDRWGIAASLNNLGVLALHEGVFAEARALLGESLQIRRELGDKRCMAVTLNNMGLAACGQRDAKTARAFLEESLILAREIGDRRSIAYSLEAFARLSALEAETGSIPVTGLSYAERAAVLGGAAEALREAISAPLPPADRAQYEPLVAAVRAALGEARFAPTWAIGRSLPLAAAVGFALQGGESLAQTGEGEAPASSPPLHS
jgi:predicted ATPase/DNA-binding SARP family transcriptional activator